MGPLSDHEHSGMMQTECTPSGERPWVDLSAYDNAGYDPGCGALTRFLWYFVSLLVFESGWVPVSRPKAWLLRLFGAQIGAGLVIKPNVRIKYPWRFLAGDHCWIGQEVWIDNLADVRLGDHVCLSQRTYVCTGGHDYRQCTFNLTTAHVAVENGAWIGAAALLLGGVRIGANAVVASGSLVKRDVPPATIVGGVPAGEIGRRSPPPPAVPGGMPASSGGRAA